MDIIRLLPDSVANQIAAGEVIQRPASVVKELVENSIDAGATQVTVVVRGAGRTSIQVVDNGKGMSSTDARLAFERHATSKIAAASDLFALSTMGFRGEALASIVAVAQVEIRTRTENDELGTLIEFSGSKVERQEMVQCPKGAAFVVKNLFFNVPARRKFLKSDETELRNIIQEMQRIVLAHTGVAFRLYSDDDLLYDLAPGSFKQRIVAVFDRRNRNIARQLLSVDADTTLVSIHGFVGTPESAGRNTPQFFFVNGRYMNHPYFRRAVVQAYERMVAADDVPLFFLDLKVDPSAIDVNIHPTKTEIKFENEREIWSIISIAVREALGKFNIVPSIDFNTDGRPDFPVPGNAGPAPSMPEVTFNPNYNPFARQAAPGLSGGGGGKTGTSDIRNWQRLFNGACQQTISFPGRHDVSGISQPGNMASAGGAGTADGISGVPAGNAFNDTVLHRNRYICISLKSGLALVDIERAMWRVCYDDLVQMVAGNAGVTQKLLFPEIIELSVDDRCLFTEIECDLRAIGFDFVDAGRNLINISGIPAILAGGVDISSVIDLLLRNIKDGGGDVAHSIRQIITRTIAHSAALKKMSDPMTSDDRTVLLGRLFSSSNPNFTPEGSPIMSILTDDDIASRF
ncbi:MAG: DNA mismatch repair endonuclease MutL [Candidatus Aphodosoma sp.]